MNGIFAWLNLQAHIAMSVIGAVVSNKPAPARQTVVYTLVLITLAFLAPKIVKLVSK